MLMYEIPTFHDGLSRDLGDSIGNLVADAVILLAPQAFKHFGADSISLWRLQGGKEVFRGV